jgi:outer membrane receptor protein involved in Fe transport
MHRSIISDISIRVTYLTISLLGAHSVAAQETTSTEQDSRADQGIEEIIVTASKRGTSVLQDTPTSIRAFTRETLEDQNITQFENWARFVPSVTFKDLGPGEKTVVTRGLVSTGAATTAVYFDEVVITAFNDGEGGGRNVDFKVHDLERIEVLRGPQGTLYGGSALGGLVRLLPAQPDSTALTGRVDVSGSDTTDGGGNYAVNAYLNVPLIEDRLALRAVGWYEDSSGYIDQIRFGIDDINDEETTGGRLMLRWNASENVTVSSFVMHQNQEIGGVSRFNPVGSVAQQLPGFTDPPLVVMDDLQNTDFTQNPREDEATLWSLKAEFDYDFGSIVAVTNLYDREFLNNFDSTPILLFFGVPIPAISSFPEDRQIWSNELRFSSSFDGQLQVLAGLFYQEEDLESSSDVFSVDSNGLIIGDTPDILQVVRDRSFDESAIFGEVTYDFNDKLSATVGARFAQFDFVTDENALVPFFGPPTGPEPTKSGDDDATTLKFNVSYKLSEDNLLYFTAAEGFRRGGLNLNAFGDLFDIPETFESDQLWNFEIGAKTSWFENRLIVNASLFTIQWEDIQVETTNDQNTAEFFTNAGEAQIDGLELELFARPIDGLDITATVGLMDARLTENQPPRSSDPNDPIRGLDGDPINNVPDWTASLSAKYTWEWISDYDGFVRVDVAAQDGSNTLISPRNPFNVRLDSYSTTNLQLGIRNRRWRIVAYADNLFDERSENDAINEFTNILAFITSRPRTVGVRAGYRF